MSDKKFFRVGARRKSSTPIDHFNDEPVGQDMTDIQDLLSQIETGNASSLKVSRNIISSQFGISPYTKKNQISESKMKRRRRKRYRQERLTENQKKDQLGPMNSLVSIGSYKIGDIIGSGYAEDGSFGPGGSFVVPPLSSVRSVANKPRSSTIRRKISKSVTSNPTVGLGLLDRREEYSLQPMHLSDRKSQLTIEEFLSRPKELEDEAKALEQNIRYKRMQNDTNFQVKLYHLQRTAQQHRKYILQKRGIIPGYKSSLNKDEKPIEYTPPPKLPVLSAISPHMAKELDKIPAPNFAVRQAIKQIEKQFTKSDHLDPFHELRKKQHETLARKHKFPTSYIGTTPLPQVSQKDFTKPQVSQKDSTKTKISRHQDIVRTSTSKSKDIQIHENNILDRENNKDICLHSENNEGFSETENVEQEKDPKVINIEKTPIALHSTSVKKPGFVLHGLSAHCLKSATGLTSTNLIQTPQAIDPPTKQRHNILKHSAEESRLQVNEMKYQSTRMMSAMLQRLPRNLVAKAMNDEVYGFRMKRFVNMIKKSLNNMIIKYLELGLHRWREEIQRQILASRIKYATIIQRRYRIYWGWKDIQDKLGRIRNQEREAQKDSRERVLRRIQGTTHLQRLYRGYESRKSTKKFKLLVESCKKVQQHYRIHHSKALMFFLKILKEAKIRLAVHAQRIFRAFRDRKHVKLLLTLRRMRRAKLQRERERAERLLLFRKHGAANYIKEWWRGIERYKQLRNLIKARKFKMALRVQRYITGTFKERRRFLAKKKVQYHLRRILQVQACKKIREDLYWSKIRITAQRRQKKKQAGEADLQELSYFGGRFKTVVDMQALKKNKHKLRRAVKLGIFNKARKLEKAAILVQKCYRGKLGRKKVKRKIHLMQKARIKSKIEKRMNAVILVQSRIRGHLMKKRVLMKRYGPAASKIQRRFLKWNSARKKKMAIVLQRYLKGSMQRKKFRALLDRMRRYQGVVAKIQSMVRGYHGRILASNLRDSMRRLEDVGWCGRAEYAHTRKYWKYVLTLRTIRVKKKKGISPEVLGVWGFGGIFCNFAKEQGASKQLTIDNSSFKKMISQAHNLLDKSKITATKCDIIFAKYKKKNERVLNFSQFLDALLDIANLKYPAATNFNELRAQHRIGKLIPNTRTPGRLGGIFNPLTPGEIRLILVIHNHLLYSNGVVFNKSARKKLESKVTDDLTWAQRVCAASWRRYKGKELMALSRIAKEAWLEAKRKGGWVIRIQLMVRRYQAKARRWAVINDIFVKFMDPETKEPYYFNKRTNEKSWHRPACLRDGYWDYDANDQAYWVEAEDLDNIFTLPTPEREFVVLCSQCEEERVEVVCRECETQFCSACYDDTHCSGKRKKHTKLPVDICGECGYQVATRHCLACKLAHRKTPKKAKLCDNCFENIHMKKSHSWTPIVATCVECEDYAVKWWCIECDEPYCTICFEKVHSHGQRMLHNAKPEPLLLVDIWNKKIQEERARIEAEQLAERDALRAQFQLMAMHQSATKFQAMYRGKMIRRAGRERMRQQRLWERAESIKVRQEQDRQKLTSTRFKNIGRSAASIIMEDKFSEELPGTVTLVRDKRTLHTTVDITDLLKENDRILIVGRKFTVKRARRKSKKKKRRNAIVNKKTDAAILMDSLKSPAQRLIDKIRLEQQQKESIETVLQIMLVEKWDGFGNFATVPSKNVKLDSQGNCTRVKGVKCYKLPKHSKVALFAARLADGVRDKGIDIGGVLKGPPGSESTMTKIRESETAEALSKLWGVAKDTDAYKNAMDTKAARISSNLVSAATSLQAQDLANAVSFLGRAIRGKEDVRATVGGFVKKIKETNSIMLWNSLHDKKTGRTYYFCGASGETSWKMPEGDIRIVPFEKPKKKRAAVLSSDTDSDSDVPLAKKFKRLLRRKKRKVKDTKQISKSSSSDEEDSDDDSDDDNEKNDEGGVVKVIEKKKVSSFKNILKKKVKERPPPPPIPEGGFDDSDKNKESDSDNSDDDENINEAGVDADEKKDDTGINQINYAEQDQGYPQNSILDDMTSLEALNDEFGYETDEGGYNTDGDHFDNDAYQSDDNQPLYYVEKRIDPSDGTAYTEEEFRSVYGENSAEWNNAKIWET